MCLAAWGGPGGSACHAGQTIAISSSTRNMVLFPLPFATPTGIDYTEQLVGESCPFNAKIFYFMTHT